MPGWDTFAVIIGGSAGALIGLLFISVSIRIDVISASPDFRNRGAQTPCLFTTVLPVAVLLGIPGQHEWELGAELLVVGVVLGGGLFWLNRRATASPSIQPISRVLAVVSPGTTTTLLLAAAGVLLLAGRGRWRLCRRAVGGRGDNRRRGQRMAVPDPDHPGMRPIAQLRGSHRRVTTVSPTCRARSQRC